VRIVSMGYLIDKSVKRATFILFKPFSLKKWLLLLFIALMAGALGGNGNSGGSGGGGKSQDAEAVPAQEQSVFDVYSEQDEVSDQTLDYDSLTQASQQEDRVIPSKKAMFILMPLFVILVLFLIFFFTWISSRFKFIWFNSIVNNDVSIKEPFRRFKAEGNSLFKFYLVMFIIVLFFFGLLVLWGYLAGSSAGLLEPGAQWTFAKGFQAFALPLLILIAGITVLALFNVCIEHFVVTIMGLERSCFLTAWRNFAAIAKENLKDIFLYFLVLIGLAIACGIIGLFIVIFAIIGIVIVGGLVFGLSYALFVALLKAKVIFYIFCVIVGIPFAIAAILLLLCTQLPFAVFFRCFSLYYLSSLNCGYVPLVLDEAAPEPTT